MFVAGEVEVVSSYMLLKMKIEVATVFVFGLEPGSVHKRNHSSIWR